MLTSSFLLENDTVIEVQLNPATSLRKNTTNTFKIYSNSANDFLMIEAPKEMDKVEVFDITGKIILSEYASGTTHNIKLPTTMISIAIVKVEFQFQDFQKI